MCKAFWISRKRFIECEYAPSYAGLFAELESDAYRCRKVCGDFGANSDAAITVLANRKV